MPAVRPAERRQLTDDPLRAILPPTSTSTGAVYHRPTVSDGRHLWDLARRSGTLDLNSPYAYLLLSHHFADTSVVAEVDGEVAGFVVGYRPPPTPDVVFVWQVAVDHGHRGLGIAAGLLSELIRRTTPAGVRFLEATVTPSNEPSTRLFTAAAKRHGADLRVTPLFTTDHFPDAGHEDEQLFRIGPIQSPSTTHRRT